MFTAASDDDDDLLFTPAKSSGLRHLQEHSSYYGTPDGGHLSLDTDDQCFSNTLMQQSNTSSLEDGVTPSDARGQLIDNDQLTRGRAQRQGSIVDGLLHEIYDRWHYGRHDSIDSDTLTECSSTSEFFFHGRHDSGGYHSASEKRHAGHLHKSFLQNQSKSQLGKILADLQHSIAVMNVRLVKQLKRRDRCLARLQRNCDVVTAILQAASLKRQIDTRMKFSIQPPPGQSAFEQWRDAMKAVCRLPTGVPPEFRKKVWLSLADHYLHQLKVNWENTVRFVFNERSNPDDEQLGMQIVKDLHRTGCSNFSGDDNDEDRAVLKRLLLAYARWNKRVGYCQGFNVIAALLLNVMDRKEDDALKVMIYMIDSVLPESYFANNLRALSVDMAVFRDLLKLTYPKLSKHLDKLQTQAQDIRTGACYEPPLTNVFTMQWFLTLFATCLPVNIVLRVWDAILLEGSEILLRTALTIWGKLAKRIMGASSADEFYCLMGELSSGMMQGYVFDGDTMIKSIYSLGDFPFPHLNELREKYTYNIRPLSQASAGNKKNEAHSVIKSLINSDEDDLEDDDITAMACMPGGVNSPADISVLGPGVYGPSCDDGIPKGNLQMERMTTDIQSLKLQYEKLKQRQRQAHIIIAAASAKKAKPASAYRIGMLDSALMPSIETPTAMNHLFVGKNLSASSRNRLVTDGPRIAAPEAVRKNRGVLAKQVQAVASAKAASKSQRMRTGTSAKSGSLAAITAATSVPSSSLPKAQSNDSLPLLPLAEHSGSSIPSSADYSLPVNQSSLENAQERSSRSSVSDSSCVAKSFDTTSELYGYDRPELHCGSETVGTEGNECRILSIQEDKCVNFVQNISEAPDLDVALEKCIYNDSQCHDIVLLGSKELSETYSHISEEVCLAPLRDDVSVEPETCSTHSGVSDTLDSVVEIIENGEQEKISHFVLDANENESLKEFQSDGDQPLNQETETEPCDESENSATTEGDTGKDVLATSPVIETIPIPKLVALTFNDEPGGITHRQSCRKITNSSNIEQSRPSLVIPPSVAALPKNHNRARRYSSPAQSVTAVTNGQLSPGFSSGLRKNSVPFSPFPVKQLNANRVKTGLKLGLYKPSTLEQFGVRKSSTTS